MTGDFKNRQPKTVGLKRHTVATPAETFAAARAARANAQNVYVWEVFANPGIKGYVAASTAYTLNWFAEPLGHCVEEVIGTVHWTVRLLKGQQ